MQLDLNDLLQLLSSLLGDMNYFVKWYLQTLVMYPAILLILAIMLQYFCAETSKIRYYACYVVVVIYPVVFGLILMPFFMLNKPGLHNCLYGANVLKIICKIIGVKWELRNMQYLSEKTGSAIVVANHQSLIDVLGMFEIWHIMVRCTAIAKKQLFWVWPFGLLAWKAGVIFISRQPSNTQTYETVSKAATLIREERAKLWFYPEGTRNKNPGTLLPFKKGAFRQAIECQIPVIPVLFSPYYYIDDKKKYFGRGTTVIQALEPVKTEGLKMDDLDDLVQKVYNAMSEKNTQLREEILNKHS